MSTPADVQPDPQPDETAGKRQHRERAQAAEQRAEAAEARLVALQTRDAARIAQAAGLAQGADVLDAALGGVALDALLDEDGVVDPDAVERAVAEVVAARPGLTAPRRTSARDYDGGPREAPPRTPSWSSVIRAGQR